MSRKLLVSLGMVAVLAASVGGASVLLSVALLAALILSLDSVPTRAHGKPPAGDEGTTAADNT